MAQVSPVERFMEIASKHTRVPEDESMLRVLREKLGLFDVDVPEVNLKFEVTGETVSGKYVTFDMPSLVPEKVVVYLRGTPYSSAYLVKRVLEKALDLKCTPVQIKGDFPYKELGFECVSPKGYINPRKLMGFALLADKLAKDMYERETLANPEDREFIEKFLREEVRRAKGKKKAVLEKALEALERGDREAYMEAMGYGVGGYPTGSLGYFKKLGRKLAERHMSEAMELARKLTRILEKEEKRR